ncbi:MAG TPA: multicopper oxidase domain-containing protein [Sporichthyaceae bacterium]|nr:multicopper oxidase domain-containing protein [Sporichthyaceae bacterium]
MHRKSPRSDLPDRRHAKPRPPRFAGATGMIAVGAATVLIAAGTPAAVQALSNSAAATPMAGTPTPSPAPNVQLPPRPVVGPLYQTARDLGDGTKLAAWHAIDNVKIFNLNIAPQDVETAPGVIKKAIGINGTVPAPTIRVNEGDRVRFVVHNQMAEPTSIHWHGMDLPNNEDGVPGITQKEIAAGSTFTYEWTAISTGTHWYHSHMHGDQEGRGVYGALEVVPLVDDIAADRDYTLIFGDGPLGFVLNGRSFPNTTRMPARLGERIRIRLIGAGPNLIHSIHLHSGFFEVLAQDGHRLPAPYEADTVVLGVGQTYDLLFIPTRVGAWMIHCHIFSHSETRHGMTGMVTFFDVYPANSVVTPTVHGTGDVAEEQEH